MFSITGLEIKIAILQELKEISFSLDDLRVQEYDGSVNMSGKHNGLQNLMLNE